MSSANTANNERSAPELIVSEWVNSEPLSLEALRGEIVVLHAFQMLCPGCVMHGLPQTARIQRTFEEVRVIGLHCVFEHHSGNSKETLEAFLHEFGYSFPVGIDAPSLDARHPIPQTMTAYGFRGTPSLVLIDRAGNVRGHYFGSVDDLFVGGEIGKLVMEEERGIKAG